MHVEHPLCFSPIPRAPCRRHPHAQPVHHPQLLTDHQQTQSVCVSKAPGKPPTRNPPGKGAASRPTTEGRCSFSLTSGVPSAVLELSAPGGVNPVSLAEAAAKLGMTLEDLPPPATLKATAAVSSPIRSLPPSVGLRLCARVSGSYQMWQATSSRCNLLFSLRRQELTHIANAVDVLSACRPSVKSHSGLGQAWGGYRR